MKFLSRRVTGMSQVESHHVTLLNMKAVYLIDKHVNSMENRVWAVIDAKGSHTRY
jgi:hypothetical protein